MEGSEDTSINLDTRKAPSNTKQIIEKRLDKGMFVPENPFSFYLEIEHLNKSEFVGKFEFDEKQFVFILRNPLEGVSRIEINVRHNYPFIAPRIRFVHVIQLDFTFSL